MLYFEYALQPTDWYFLNELEDFKYLLYEYHTKGKIYFSKSSSNHILASFGNWFDESIFENTSSMVFLIRHTYCKISNGKSQNNFLSRVFPTFWNVEFCIKVLFFFENVITKARNPFCIFNTICGKETEKKSLRGGSNHLHIWSKIMQLLHILVCQGGRKVI